jgi:hypothetical protein
LHANKTKTAFEAERLIPNRNEMSLFSFKRPGDIEKFVVGADADLGGPSEGYLALTSRNTGKHSILPTRHVDSFNLQCRIATLPFIFIL